MVEDNAPIKSTVYMGHVAHLPAYGRRDNVHWRAPPRRMRSPLRCSKRERRAHGQLYWRKHYQKYRKIVYSNGTKGYTEKISKCLRTGRCTAAVQEG